MEEHLDIHWSDFPSALDVIGKITAVWLPDNPKNPTGNITLYQVKGLLQRPKHAVLISDYVPHAGMQGGGPIEKEVPLTVGQHVVVGFFEGDPNRPYIKDTYIPKQQNTNIQQTEDTYPQPTWLTNGVGLHVTKDGNAKIDLARGRSLLVRDHNGDTIIQIKDNNGTYEIDLGGNTGLKKLMTEDLITALRGIWSGVTPVPNDGGAAIKTAFTLALSDAFRDANSTSVTKAR